MAECIIVKSSDLEKKQDKLTSGQNIRTISGVSLLGSGDIVLTSSDVGLGSVVNTSDGSVPEQNGTKKFTTGGAYDLKAYIDNKHSVYYGSSIPSSSFGNDGDVFVLYS